MPYQTIRPMLAAEQDRDLTWSPEGYWVQPKYDGLRCLIDPEAGPVTRSGEPVANPYVRDLLSDPAMIGLDGELTAPGGLEAAQSAFTGSATLPEGWAFVAFDDLKAFSQPFSARMASLRRRADRFLAWAVASPARLAARPGDLQQAFADVLQDHRRETPGIALDGFCLRHAARNYREGRTTVARGELVKIKPMTEAEAVILDVSARSDDPDALAAVRVSFEGETFWAPAGLGREAARDLWTLRDSLPGRQATLRSWGRTGRGLPRHAVAVALRRAA